MTFEHKAFGKSVNLDERQTIKAMSSNVARYVCVQTFKKALLNLAISEQEPKLLGPDRPLSSTPPFPWSRPVYEGRKCVFNLVACDNEFERTFAKFLDLAEDVKTFAKLPTVFGFAIDYADGGNLRSYYPDFVAVDVEGRYWILPGHPARRIARSVEYPNPGHQDWSWPESPPRYCFSALARRASSMSLR